MRQGGVEGRGRGGGKKRGHGQTVWLVIALVRFCSYLIRHDIWYAQFWFLSPASLHFGSLLAWFRKASTKGSGFRRVKSNRNPTDKPDRAR